MAETADGLGTLAEASFGGVIFDMDGTLIDSTPAVRRAWLSWAAEHALDPDIVLGHHGMPSAAVVALLLPEPARAAAVRRINEIELADVDGVVVLPGAAEALAAVAPARAAIATSCTTPLAAVRIAASNLAAPAVLVTADDVAHGKPAPDPFLEAARRLAVPPTDCLVVEDAPAGLAAARAAGCHTLAVTTTTERDQLQADAVLGSLADVEFLVSDGRIRLRRTGRASHSAVG